MRSAVFLMLAVAGAAGCSLEVAAPHLEDGTRKRKPAAHVEAPRVLPSTVSNELPAEDAGSSLPVAKAYLEAATRSCVPSAPTTLAQPCMTVEHFVNGSSVARTFDSLGRVTALGTISDGGFVPRESYQYGPHGLTEWTSDPPEPMFELRAKQYSYGADGGLESMTFESVWYSAHVTWSESDGGSVASASLQADAGMPERRVEIKVDGGSVILMVRQDFTPQWVTVDDHGRVRSMLRYDNTSYDGADEHWEYDEEGQLLLYSYDYSDLKGTTTYVWTDKRLQRSVHSGWTTSGVTQVRETNYVYDRLGNLVSRTNELAATRHGEEVYRSATRVIFSNACGSGEPLTVTKYSSNAPTKFGAVRYTRDSKNRLIAADYAGVAVEELGATRREWLYCDGP